MNILCTENEFKLEIYRQIAEKEARGSALKQWLFQCKRHALEYFSEA